MRKKILVFLILVMMLINFVPESGFASSEQYFTELNSSEFKRSETEGHWSPMYFINIEQNKIYVDLTSGEGENSGNLYVNEKYIDNNVSWNFFSDGKTVYYEKDNDIYRADINTGYKEFLLNDDYGFIYGVYKNKYLYYGTMKYADITGSLVDMAIYDLENKTETNYVVDVGKLVIVNDKIYTMPTSGEVVPVTITEMNLDGSAPVLISTDAASHQTLEIINNEIYYVAMDWSEGYNEKKQVKKYNPLTNQTTTLTDFYDAHVWYINEDYAVFSDSNMNKFEVYYNIELEIKVVLNGEEIQFDQPPIMAEGDRVMVPIRPVAEAMGDVVKWCGDLNSALVVHNDRMVVFRNDDNEACIYGDTIDKSTWDTYYCDVPPQNINGRTLTPVRAIGECLGAKVDWNGDTKTVTIDYETNTPNTLSENALAQINALYFTYHMPESDFSEYSADIDYFCENRSGWSDAFIIWMDDWTIALDIFASGEKTNVYMIKQCLAEMLSEMPDSGVEDFEVYTEILDWLSGVSQLADVDFTKVDKVVNLSVQTANSLSKLGNAIDKAGTTLDLTGIGIDVLAEVLSDYSTGMYYIDVLRTSLYDAGITDETIHNSLNELENEYVHKYANSIYDNVIDIGSGATLNAVTGKGFKAAETFKDLAMLAGEAITDNKDKATHVKNLNCIYLFNDYIDDAYNDIRYTLLTDTSKLDEYMVMFNLQKIIKTKAYNAMDILSDKDDPETRRLIEEQTKKLSELTYIIFE